MSGISTSSGSSPPSLPGTKCAQTKPLSSQRGIPLAPAPGGFRCRNSGARHSKTSGPPSACGAEAKVSSSESFDAVSGALAPAGIRRPETYLLRSTSRASAAPRSDTDSGIGACGTAGRRRQNLRVKGNNCRHPSINRCASLPRNRNLST